jgi:light-regulated signal transduction histidine kinase (bacteriophytochrome)
MMGYKPIHCSSLDYKKDTNSATKILYKKQKEGLVKELVDPICIISNANEILSSRLSNFVDKETNSYFEMISRAVTKTKTLVEELRQETNQEDNTHSLASWMDT